MRYEKYVIGKLFTSQNGDTDIKKEDITGTGVPVITSGVDKNGVLGNTDVKARIIKANTITIDMFGNAFFRPFEYKMVTHARVFSMELVGREMNEAIGLFLTTQFHWLPSAYNYSNMCSYNKIKDLTIILPTLDELYENSPYSDEGFVPDFDYMQERIEELEQERIEELEQYLVATSLNDYELTDEDIETLSLSGFRHYEERDSEDAVKVCKEMREFRCGDLFDIHPTKAYKMSNDELYQTSGNSPVLSNSSVDNGIGGYCGLDTTENGKIITFSDTTTGTDTMFYQPNSFIGYAHVQGMYPFDENWGEFQQRYFICAMKQACGTGWDYSNKFNRKLVAEMTPLLPIQTDTGNNPIIDTECKYHPDGYIPDWNFMEKYIRAIEKIVIADVVQYKDAMISKTKEVVA